MPTIDIHDLSFSYTAEPLLHEVSLSIGDGERACLVGPNGCGKSTLLEIAGGRIMPDSGVATIRGVHVDTALHAPSIGAMTGTVREYLDGALTELRTLAARFEEVSLKLAERAGDPSASAEYDALLATMTSQDVWSLDARIDETLAGLGLSQFTGEGQSRPLSTLSPGQARRLKLAATLLIQPDVLLLDEPTNHLDDDAVHFLATVLIQHPGPLLMASHDRAFIDEVTTVIYDLDIAPWQALATANGGGRLPGVQTCAGSYHDYLQAKEQARAAHRELHSTQQATKRAVREHRHASRAIAQGGVRLAEAEGKAKKFFADRAQATSVRRTRNDDRRLDELTAREVRRPRSYELHFPLAPATSRPGVAVMAREAAVENRLTPVTFDLSTGEHLLVTGANGSGKSTLLRWMMRGEPPADTRASGALTVTGRVGAVFQRLPKPGDPGMTVDIWESGVGELGTAVLHPSMWKTPISELSDGNQRRAQLAIAVATTPDVLIVDEPTNYLDLDAIEALESALTEWNGTLIVATHDRWLIEKWTGRRLRLPAA